MTKTFPKAVASIAPGPASGPNAQHTGVLAALIGQGWFGGAMVYGLDHVNWETRIGRTGMSMFALRAAALVTLAAIAPPTFARELAPPVTAALAPAARGAAATVDAFHSALRRGDTRSASNLLAGDALIFEAGGVERSKAEYESHHLAADAAFTKAVPAVLSRRAGKAIGTMAWIASEGRTTGTFNGKPVDRVTAETMVLRRSGGQWKIVHIHWSSAPKR